MKARTARWIAGFMVGVFFLLATVGLTLQIITNTPYTGIPFPIIITAVLIAGVWQVTGALIVSRHPRNPIGWLMLASTIVASFDMFAAGYAAYAVTTHAGTLPGLTLALFWLEWSVYPFFTTGITLVMLLFPEGRLPSQGWRVVSWTSIGAVLTYLPVKALTPGPVDPFSGIFVNNPLGVSASVWTFLDPVLLTAETLMGLCYLASVGSLFIKLRQARGDERQQIKWLVTPTVLYLIMIPFIGLSVALGNYFIMAVGLVLGLPAIIGIIIAIAFAIFRYRLYDIDIIIRRTLQYTLLTAFLALVYFSGVTLLQMVFTTLSGQSSSLAVVLSTLAIAALFNPLRSRLQDFIDRRFYRQKYDAELALAKFAQTAREETDLEFISERLTSTVQETLQPDGLSLWFSAGQGRSPQRE